MRYFKAKKGLFQLRYIYGKLRYPVHFVLTGFFCKLFIYKGLKGFFGVVYVHFIMLFLSEERFVFVLYKNNKNCVIFHKSRNFYYVALLLY